jgi:large subunit ribosomal protein L10
LAITRERKEELVEEYVDLLGRSQAIFIAEYKGLTVKRVGALRAEIRKADGSLHVTKNTLLSLALERSGMPVPQELLAGQVATTFALSEAATLAKALLEFARTEELFRIRGGILGPAVLTAEQVETLARLPGRDELRAQLLGMLRAPAQSVAAAVASGVRQVVNVLDAYARKDGEAAAA